MKDYLLELISKQAGPAAKFNIMREYLQAYILRIMHDDGFFRRNAFLGGTALRFLYNLPRFSEDLDFSTTDGEALDFIELIKKVKTELSLSGYALTVTYKETKAVFDAFFRFEQLMFDAGLSPLKSQKFSVKLEIDTNPPRGAALKTGIVNKYFPISFLSYDLPSLFAGKLHALLSRKYTKGRDYFDLGWYLSKWKDLSPNFTLLANALKQTGWKGELPVEDNWRRLIADNVARADWNKVYLDVKNFLENPTDMKVFSRENVINLLNK